MVDRDQGRARSDLRGDSSTSTRLMRDPRVLWRRVSRGAVLLGPTGVTAQISPTGVAVWECLDEPRSSDAVAELLGDRFGVGVGDVHRDLVDTIGELVDLGMIIAVP